MTLILKAIPETLHEAVEIMHLELTDWERNHLLQMSRPQSSEGLGLLSRPEWRLWDLRSPLVIHCTDQYSLAHSQDLSCLLMEALWSKVHGVRPMTKSLAATLRSRWRNQGFDPVTMSPLSENKSGQPPVILQLRNEA